MKKANPTPKRATPPSRLGVVLARIQNLRSERDIVTGKNREHAALIPKLEAEEKALLDGADLDNQAAFQKLSDLRLRRELVPKRIAAFQRQEKQILDDLRSECETLRLELRKTVEHSMRIITTEIAVALQPFFAGRRADSQAAAAEVAYQTNYGRNIYQTEQRLRSGVLQDRHPIYAAAELADMVPLVESLEIYTAPPGNKPAPPTVEDFEREELRKITLDPEPFVLVRMKCLSQAEAEKAVEERRKYLADKYSETSAEFSARQIQEFRRRTLESKQFKP